METRTQGRGVKKASGKEKRTSTAKKVDKLRISFDLNENMIAQSGNKRSLSALQPLMVRL